MLRGRGPFPKGRVHGFRVRPYGPPRNDKGNFESASEEVRSALDISETNQRVLLHRARSKVRAALEDYYADA